MELSVVVKRRPDGTYEATSPSVPDCVSRGRTRKEALDLHLRDIRSHLAAGSDHLPDTLEFHVASAE